MIDLYINVRDQTAWRDPWSGRQFHSLDLSSGDTQGFNLYFCDPTRYALAPLAIRRYAGATVAMTLVDASNTAQATQGSWTELVNNSGGVCTLSIASPCNCAFQGSGLWSESINGVSTYYEMPCVFTTTGALPTGLTAGTVYYLDALGSNLFTVSTTPGGTVVNTSGSQSGVHTVTLFPLIKRATSGDATHGEYDRIILPDVPGSGWVNLLMTSGVITSLGATSATARIIPGVTGSNEIAASFASMIGAPWSAQQSKLNQILDIHGTAVATPSQVTGVGISDLQFLFGYTAYLAMTSLPAGMADPMADTPQVALLVKLTPSGGAAASVLRLPVNLHA